MDLLLGAQSELFSLEAKINEMFSMDECMIIILTSMHQIRKKDRLSNDRMAASSLPKRLLCLSSSSLTPSPASVVHIIIEPQHGP